MQFLMSYRDYVAALRGRENDPASLNVLLAPFRISGLPHIEDEFLLVGHVLDAIADEHQEQEPLDAVFVLEMAMDLGLPS